MKKALILLIFTILSLQMFAQGEANIWYFGDNSGLDFNSGTPVATTNGAIQTIEGCAAISDSSGNLLFYTDGITVYTSNDVAMPNGIALHGNPSSSQSAIIVPKPENPDRYYIFTVDEHNTNQFGLQYSEVDMTLNGGLGDVVTGQKNIPLLDHCSEKITAVKSDNCSSIWVIAFSSTSGASRNYSTFHSFEVANTGVNTSSVTSSTSVNITDGRGYMKMSADGTRLGIVHSGLGQNGVLLYDFDYTTGLVSSQIQLNLSDSTHSSNLANTIPYGLEFSLSTEKLYVTSIASGRTFDQSPQDGYLWQFDLTTLGNPVKLIAHNTNTYRGALQMGPNGKIYRALSAHYNLGSNFLGAINSPEILGVGCNYQHNAIDLGSGVSRQGLPPFIQSLFLSNIDIINNDPTVLVTNLDLCDGDTYRLQPADISTYPAITSYTWYLDDVLIVPLVTTSFIDIDGVIHGSGEYKLEINFNNGSCEFFGVGTVTYHSYPVVTTPITVRQCDDDTDGISVLDLTAINSSISTNFVNETFTYHTTLVDANTGTNEISVVNEVNYITASTTLWVRVDNGFCHIVEQVDIIVSATNTNYTGALYECDDYVDTANDDRDGITTFDLTQVETAVKNIFPIGIRPNLLISFYHNILDAQLQLNEILPNTAYRNIGSPNTERIYIRVNNNTNLDCAGLGINLYVDLVVESLPVANPITEIRGCDDGTGQSTFDTTGVINTVLQGQSGVTLTYYDFIGIQIPTANFLPSYTSISQTITIRATNNTTNDPDGACYEETTLKFIVDVVPVANPVIVSSLCDDLPDQTDGMAVFDTSSIGASVLGGTQPNTEIRYYYANGSEILPTLPEYFNTGSQIIMARVININNTNCYAETTLDFQVIVDNPVFDISDHLLCLDQLPDNPLEVHVENPQGAYEYYWENERGEEITTATATQDFVTITEGGEYTVIAIATTGSMCTTTKKFVVAESSIPKIETVTIFDDLPNNRVSVLVSGAGDYEFALDSGNFEDANELEGHIFYNVIEGAHIIHIRDKNGCTPVVSREIVVIRFPRFITPNHDGLNDTFYVYGGEGFATTSVVIYDRYGKIITNLNEATTWDGFYLGRLAIESDYWFVAIFIDNKGKKYERKGHFSLKL